MPKIKKIRAAALTAQESVRHAPLGQTIQDDENRNKYAQYKYRRGNSRDINNNDDDDDGIDGSEFPLMDAKSSQRIMKLSKEQRLEMEAEEELQRQKDRRKQGHNTDMVVPDSDDDEGEEQEEQDLDVEEEE